MEFDKLATRADHEEGVEVQITNPVNDEPTDVYITIVGPDSKEWRRSNKSDLRMALARKRDEPWTDDELLERDIDKLVSITKGWRGITKDGKPLEFSAKTCRELYEAAPTVMDQVDRYAADYENFTKD